MNAVTNDFLVLVQLKNYSFHSTLTNYRTGTRKANLSTYSHLHFQRSILHPGHTLRGYYFTRNPSPDRHSSSIRCSCYLYFTTEYLSIHTDTVTDRGQSLSADRVRDTPASVRDFN